MVFVFEIRCEAGLSDVFFYFFPGPETPFVHFVVIDSDAVVAGAEEGEYQFFFAGAFPDVTA